MYGLWQVCPHQLSFQQKQQTGEAFGSGTFDLQLMQELGINSSFSAYTQDVQFRSLDRTLAFKLSLQKCIKNAPIDGI